MPDFPKRVYVYQSERGYLIADEEIDEIPDGIDVGIYELQDVQRKVVQHSMIARGSRKH
jgi:hypothetical protein